MAGVNRVILIGNLGKDPEVRTFESGAIKTTITVATSESYKTKTGEKVENTEWHNVVLWRGLAEVAEKYLKKGSKVYIEGKLRYRSYEDKEGNKKYITEIEADNMVMLDGRSNRQEEGYVNSGSQFQETVPPVKEDAEPDDLPF